jgi:tRNA (5-methylaminomethyl-2-thiouridylate)-methyltransferase
MPAKKVFVGMSGGVDSSVSAALLVESGYDVTGVYMRNWSRDLPGMKCPWADDLADAKRVAVQLGIDFRIFDFETEYREKVVQYMIDEYKAGRTPNPDIMCNQEVKFKLFHEMSMTQGADFVATGHYAQTSDGMLLRSVDEKKDQTYFLYRVSEDVLRRTVFPIGHLKKVDVRELAKKYNLKTATKKESMGICFVGSVGIREFLSEYVEKKYGEIRDDKSDEIVGHHDGAVFFTIGQRHGLNVGGGLPYYVTRKDIESNTIYVSTDLNNRSLWREEIKLINSHFINKGFILEDKEYQVRVRHQAPMVGARLSLKSGDVVVAKFSDEQRAITAGQSIAFYDEQVCLGGGIVS